MARKSVIDGTIAQDMTDANDNFIELYQTKDEVETARGTKATLDDRISEIEVLATDGLPDQTGNAGKALFTDGALPYWDNIDLSLTEINQANIILEAFRRMEADAYAGANAFQNGWTDALNDTSNIESSTGFSLNSGYFGNLSDDLCVGGTASGNPAIIYGSFAAMFDDDTSTYGMWQDANGTSAFLPSEIIYQFTSPVLITLLRIYIDQSYGPKDFTFYGSNDGASWVDLGSFTSIQTSSWQTFNIENVNTYGYYKIVVTASYSTVSLYFSEIEMEGLLAGSVIFNPLTCVSEPTEQRVLMIAEYDDSVVTLNTDLVVSVSNDDGTTWEDVTMSVLGDFSSAQKIIDGSKIMTSVGGTKAKVKVACTDTGSIKIHDIANFVKL
jgi:hypothetical protein